MRLGTLSVLCLEIAHIPGVGVALRNSKNRQRDDLRYTAEEWDAFRKGIIEGAL